jgi:hypothetical protein
MRLLSAFYEPLWYYAMYYASDDSDFDDLDPYDDTEGERDLEEEYLAAAAVLAVCLFSVIEAREHRNCQRRERRRYLCQKELCPNPRAGTPWQQLWQSQEDRAFITTMGFDVTTFRFVLEGPGGFGEHWESSPIP